MRAKQSDTLSGKKLQAGRSWVQIPDCFIAKYLLSCELEFVVLVLLCIKICLV